MTVNKHGLSRDIPAQVKRSVRQRCGFGCILCGSAIVQYHHFAPPFEEALVHSDDGITLLCGSCHDKVNRGLINDKTIQKANHRPKCRQVGFTKDLLFVGSRIVTVKLGSAWINAQRVIVYGDETILGFSPPEVIGGPLRLNARLYDANERPLLEIADNEWRVGTNRYDVETTANRLVVKDGSNNIELMFASVSEDYIQISQLNMNFKGFAIILSQNSFQVKNTHGGTINLVCPNVTADIGVLLDPTDGSVAIAVSRGHSS